MSDRLVFIPCLGLGLDPDNYAYADVVVSESASTEEIQAAAAQFVGLPGPRKITVADRNDPRFVALCRYLSDEYAMEEDAGSGWDYEVRIRPD